MDILLKVVGVIWAIIGLANIIALPSWGKTGEEGIIAIALVINVVLFIIPGLILYGIGVVIAKKRSKDSVPAIINASPKETVSIENRLQKLDDLLAQGVIRADEHERRRTAILNEV